MPRTTTAAAGSSDGRWPPLLALARLDSGLELRQIKVLDKRHHHPRPAIRYQQTFQIDHVPAQLSTVGFKVSYLPVIPHLHRELESHASLPLPIFFTSRGSRLKGPQLSRAFAGVTGSTLMRSARFLALREKGHLFRGRFSAEDRVPVRKPAETLDNLDVRVPVTTQRSGPIGVARQRLK